ncbi:MAG: response regulator [Pirellulaceae bacterium]|nr:response regulator [Pirellulaceae bacterium]
MARVLLVEDSPTQAADIAALLEEAHHEVQHVLNGKLALLALEDDLLDVVVTDLQMPEMNGLQLVETIKKEFAHIPAILITSQASQDLATQALQRGAASYVPKEEMRSLLNDTIKDVLGVIRGDGSYAKLLARLTKNAYVFKLPNDGELIAPLVNLIMQVVAGLETLGGTDLVRLGVAIEQAVMNAMYRGNLELTKNEAPSPRAVSDHPEKYPRVKERLTTAPYKDRLVYVEALATKKAVRIVIRDEGKGFDTSITPDGADSQSMGSGMIRGLVLMTSFVDKVQFNDRGNEVTLVKKKV